MKETFTREEVKALLKKQAENCAEVIIPKREHLKQPLRDDIVNAKTPRL